jgi:phosphoribosylformylglycinamidine (FGAM) synthase-like enzyme
MPIVSGNVSLYNETDGQAILPTPTIGAVGLLDTLDDLIADTIRDGHVLLLVGETTGHLGPVRASVGGLQPRGRRRAARGPGGRAAQRRFHPREPGQWINACTDLSDGGLALAGFEMAVAGGVVGITLDAADTATLFGEDQARYLIATSFDKAEALMVAAGQAGVPMLTVGRVGGDAVRIGGSEAPLADLRAVWANAFAEHFG